MSITAGSTARADDFINKAQRNVTPSADVGRVVKIESHGQLENDFLQPVTYTVTAETDITLGQPVGFSMNMPGFVAKAFEDIISASVGTVGTMYGVQGIAANSFIVNYKLLNTTFNNAFYVTLITVNPATNALTVGNTVTLYGVGTHEFDSDQPAFITTNDCLVTVYENINGSTTHNTQAHIIRLSAGTISVVGSATLHSFAAGANGIRTVSNVMLSATQGVWMGYNATAAQRQLVPFTISGTTITVGTSFNDQDQTARHQLIKITGTKVGYMRTDGTFKVHTIVGNAATSQTLNGSLIGSFGDASQATGLFVNTDEVLLVKPTAQFTVQIRRVTLSGNTATGGNTITLTVADDYNVAATPLKALARTTVYGAMLIGRSLYRINVSGANIDWQLLLYRQYVQGGNNIQLADVGGLICPISWVGSQMQFIREGMGWNFAGIAQSTVSRGATLKVITEGVDYNQSGLVEGGIYTAYNGALLQAVLPTLPFYYGKAVKTNSLII